MKRATRAVADVDRGRRQFLQAVTAAGLGGLALPGLLRGQAKEPTAASLVQGKDARLIVQTKGPVVLETPLSLLDGQAITPLDRLFVRNNQELKDSNTLKPIPLAGWKIELTGLLDKKVTLDAAEVAKLPLVEHEMVLQCSGNARSLFAKAAPVQGTPWGKGGFGNVKFAGVPLSAVLDKFGVKVDKAARFVTAEGADPPQPGKADFEHSLPLEDVLKKALLAVRLNGEPIPAVHGGPVRLVSRSTPLSARALSIKTPLDATFDGVRLLGGSLDRDEPEPVHATGPLDPVELERLLDRRPVDDERKRRRLAGIRRVVRDHLDVVLREGLPRGADLPHDVLRILDLRVEHGQAPHLPVRVARVRVVRVLDRDRPVVLERISQLRLDLLVGEVRQEREGPLRDAHDHGS